ncbi:hypothetical protein M3650_16005 [Paenibacillus sp. MER TA 81-3]|uniref:hypothetical protein n=1 Tax=Paenibacillus sp. MER TA 81-3 TaxID=2939573 RepID=UPI00203E54E8|nr:hypothetical protein [Paenibacillus sp. MER TA 81-3]MCM3340099.1 hypothetical protein [Paenibacillus sp. MER TA 81-3]
MKQTEYRYVCSQLAEQPVTTIERTFRCRHAYARAEETARLQENGQDFIALHMQGDTLSFVLCDGVSMSYQGDFAARFLGERLLDWLVSQAVLKEPLFHEYVSALTGPATTEVEQLAVPAGAPRLLREVLKDKKRRGSEAMFVCGRIDGINQSRRFRKGRLWLAWQGDCRLRLWHNESEYRQPFADKCRTSERWSSLYGPVGDRPHVLQMDCQQSGSHRYRLLLYTDGLHELDAYSERVSDKELQRMLDQPQEGVLADDASLIEIQW